MRNLRSAHIARSRFPFSRPSGNPQPGSCHARPQYRPIHPPPGYAHCCGSEPAEAPVFPGAADTHPGTSDECRAPGNRNWCVQLIGCLKPQGERHLVVMEYLCAVAGHLYCTVHVTLGLAWPYRCFKPNDRRRPQRHWAQASWAPFMSSVTSFPALAIGYVD